MFRGCHALCSLVVTCWERANLLALMFVMFSCVFVTFPCGVLQCRSGVALDSIDSLSLPSYSLGRVVQEALLIFEAIWF